MAKNKRTWVLSPSKSAAPKVSANTKAIIQQRANELVERVLKPTHIKPPPAPTEFQHNYIADIYTKWYRHYLYFCAKYNVPGPNALVPFFESKFARLEYVRDNCFTMAFMRYTGNEWVEVYFDLSLEECLEAVEKDPYFMP
ncbi:MAG: hypothetical protein ACOYYJ_07650 [Chloroflexota bacterium]